MSASNEAPGCPRGKGDHGISWVELLAGAEEASVRFYAQVFGWKIEAYGPGYWTFTPPNGGPPGGLRGDAPTGSPTCTPYIRVPDIAAAQARVVAAGGRKLTEPVAVGEASIGHFAAPNGTIYGLVTMTEAAAWQPAPFGDNPKPAPDTLCSVEMYGGPDLDDTARFFSEVFGWGTFASMPGYMMLDPGESIGGVFQSHTPVATAMPYIYVTDVPARLAEIVAAGGESLGDPMAMPGMGTFGYFKDPSGTPMGLIGP